MSNEEMRDNAPNVPQNRQIVIEPPDRCIGCGWRKYQDHPNADVFTWIELRIPNSVVWIYVCPKCGTAMGNKNAYANVQKLKAIKESKIIQPRPVNPFMPGMN